MALKGPAEEYIRNHLQNLKDEGLQRSHFHTTMNRAENWPVVIDPVTEEKVVTWCANSVLGLHVHENVIEFTKSKIDQLGVGAAGSRNISGSSSLARNLEASLAQMHRKEDCALFPSGYAANFFIKILADVIPNLKIYSDNENHNSIRTASSAAKNNSMNTSLETYTRHDLRTLEEVLARNTDDAKLIVFEDIHSMDGSVAQVEEIVTLAEKYNAILFCDSTASFGLRGYNGAGLCEEKSVLKKVDIVASTLGKAIGSQGGFITARKELTALSRLTPTYMFTTANSIPNIAAALKAVEILSSDEGRAIRKAHNEVVTKVKSLLLQKKLPFVDNDSHIIPLIVGEEEKCKLLAHRLLCEGIYVAPVFYPTVPKGKAMFRIMPSPKHTDKQISDLIEQLDKNLHQ